MMQQARSNNKVLEHLMRKKIKGELPGVLGRLVIFLILLTLIILINTIAFYLNTSIQYREIWVESIKNTMLPYPRVVEDSIISLWILSGPLNNVS